MTPPPLSPFLHAYARPSAAPDTFVTIVRGEGAAVFDAAGKRYVDALGGLWYCNIGHGREEVADAVAAQMRKIAGYHTFDRFTNEPAEAVCAEVARLAPMEGARVFLTTGGSESVETAMKLARIAHHLAGDTDRMLVVSRRPSYHGVNYGGMAATGLPLNQVGFGPMLGDVVQVAHDSLDEIGEVFAQQGDRVAAVMAEPVIGAGGVYPPVPGYFERLRALCDQHGAFLILDEVITGFGRLGRWFGAQHYGVRPDLVTFAKAITSGYQPLGGVIVGQAVLARLESDESFVLRHGYTYSGHPTACAAGVAVLAITEREGLVDRAVTVGERLAKGLAEVQGAGLVTEVRGDGAVRGVQLPDGIDATKVRDAMLERGVIVRPIGASILAYCPPLVITDDDLDRSVEVLAEAVTAVAG